jgi:hypothetical protein
VLLISEIYKTNKLYSLILLNARGLATKNWVLRFLFFDVIIGKKFTIIDDFIQQAK